MFGFSVQTVGMPKESTDRGPAIGPIGEQVVRNIEEIREARGLSLRALSDRMKALARPILPSGLQSLTQRKRRVDVDDLVALALALEVNPNALLFEKDVDWDDILTLTPAVSQRAYSTWRWAQGLAPLPADLAPVGEADKEDQTPSDRAVDWAKHALPRGGDVKFDPALRANFDLGGRIEYAVRDFANPTTWDLRRDHVLRGYRLLGIVLEEFIAKGDREVDGKTAFPFNTEGAQFQLRDSANRLSPAVDYAPGTAERLRGEAQRHYSPGAARTDNPGGAQPGGPGGASTSTWQSPAAPIRPSDEEGGPDASS